MEEKRSLQSIPDRELLRRLAELVGQSRRVEVDIVAHIAEVEERKIYAHEAFPSMFVYCKDVLHLSEQEAYLRIAVARASRKHPMLLAMLADGRLHLTAIGKLAPHLTRENRDALLERATHRSKHQIEELVAEIAPRPDVPSRVRKLPERRAQRAAGLVVIPSRADGPVLAFGPDPTFQLRSDGVVVPEQGSRPMLEFGPDRVDGPGSPPDPSAVVAPPQPSALPLSPSVVQPLSPGRYKVQFTASAEFHRKLERLTALMGSRVGGDLAAVIEQAVTEKLERLEARRFARTKAPRKGIAEKDAERSLGPTSSTRHIPAAVRRAVYRRDGGRCRYVDAQGRRCRERDRLEFHHRQPFGFGGDHSVANVCLMCRAHNVYLAEVDYGREAMDGHRRSRNRASPAPGGGADRPLA